PKRPPITLTRRRAARSWWSWPAAQRRPAPEKKTRQRRVSWRPGCWRKDSAPARSPVNSLIGSAWPVTGRTRSRSPWRGSGEEATLDRPDPEPGPAARDTGRRGQCGVGAERAGPAAAPGGGAPPHHRTAPVRRRRRLVREPVRAAQPPQGDTGADRPAG